MVKVTNEVKEALTGVKLLYLATASKDHTPNVVPIGAFKLLDDETMLISDQFFKKTLQNMKDNPKIALAFWGDKGGFQIKGTITLHSNDDVFKKDVEWMKELRPNLTPKNAVILKISEVYIIKAGPDAGKKLL